MNESMKLTIINQSILSTEYENEKLRKKEIKKILNRRFKSRGNQNSDTIRYNLLCFGLNETEIEEEIEKTKYSERPLM